MILWIGMPKTKVGKGIGLMDARLPHQKLVSGEKN